jgi:hypothetical protein
MHKIKLFKAATTQVVLRVMPDRIVPGGDLGDETLHQVIESNYLNAGHPHRAGAARPPRCRHTMIYPHALNRTGLAVRSPADLPEAGHRVG